MSEKRVIIPPHQEIVSKGNPSRNSSPESELVTRVRHVVGKLKLKKIPVRLQTLGQITAEQRDALFKILEKRLKAEPKYYTRPFEFDSRDILDIVANAGGGYLYSLAQMEITGGEPDIYSIDDNNITFADFSSESPMGRRGHSYMNALKLNDGAGLKMLSMGMYYKLQERGIFDINSFSWVLTPPSIRKNCRALLGHYDIRREIVECDENEDNCGNEAGYVGWRSLLEIPRV